MKLFEVYKLWDIEPVKGLDTTLWDKNGEVYTDLYGGHAVISVGHSHPHYVKMLSDQLGRLGFYSNAVQNSLQSDLAARLGKVCGYDDYKLFLCNMIEIVILPSIVTNESKLLAWVVDVTFDLEVMTRFQGNTSFLHNPCRDTLFIV